MRNQGGEQRASKERAKSETGRELWSIITNISDRSRAKQSPAEPAKRAKQSQQKQAKASKSKEPTESVSSDKQSRVRR